MICDRCATENAPGRKFCSQCGARLERLCPACGSANTATDRFCGDCGTTLERVGGADRAASSSSETHLTPGSGAAGSERRLVSVLFADLVGFTTLAESRDAEVVRELLDHYYQRALQIVGRYGGTVEKFISGRWMTAVRTALAARAAAFEGRQSDSVRLYGEADRLWRDLDLEWDRARTLLDRLFALGPDGPDGPAIAAIVRSTFERLDAQG